MKNKTTREFIREAFSENGVGSSKRIVGTCILLVALGCTVYLTITGGCTTCVEDLLQTFIIMACSLLGIGSITSIWKNGKASVGNHENEKTKENE